MTPRTPMNVDIEYERNIRSTLKKENINRLTSNLFDNGLLSNTKRRHILEKLIENDPSNIFNNDDNIYMHRTERHIRALAKHVRLIELCRSIGIGSSNNDKNEQEDDDDGHIIKSKEFPILLASLGDDLPTSLHWVMFVPNIMSLCTLEQQNVWLPLCRDWHMIGCYAQTELGHGSNIRALETTATFRSGVNGSQYGEDGSFIINSPTLTSTKFWPGTLGRTANYAMVIARLIDGNGIDRGIHNFVVQLRSLQDHSLMPGVQTGDVGPKIGYNVMDNGYATFRNVEIPRFNMAARFAEVDTDGSYHKKTIDAAASKIAYITMMQVRAYIVNEASKKLAMACTIAIRYSAIRKQGYDEDDHHSEQHNNSNNHHSHHNIAQKKELQILDYKQQQHRLFPLLAASYCFHFTGKKLLRRLHDIEHRLIQSSSSHNKSSSGSSGSQKQQVQNNVIAVSKLEVTDIHASSSALKSYTSMIAAAGMEECRKSCGGHGFLACSALPELINTYLQNPTVEGDNHMLPQHVFKVLLKLIQAIQNEDEQQQQQQQEEETETTTNINNSSSSSRVENDYKACDSYPLISTIRQLIKVQRGNAQQDPNKPRCNAQTMDDMFNLNILLDAYRHRAARLLLSTSKQLQDHLMNDGMTLQQAWNLCLIQMSRFSKSYSLFLLLSNFIEGIHDEEMKTQKKQAQQTMNNNDDDIVYLGSTEISVLYDLVRLFALYNIEQDIGDFIEDGYMNEKQCQLVRTCVIHMLDIIRPNAVTLVDARDFTDFILLNSALGRYDGNVYPAIMNAAKNDPLNTYGDVGPGYKEHLSKLIVHGVGKYKTKQHIINNNNNNDNSVMLRRGVGGGGGGVAGTASRL